MSKAEKQHSREKAQMEKQAAKDGKKRAREDGKPLKAKPKQGPAAKRCAHSSGMLTGALSQPWKGQKMQQKKELECLLTVESCVVSVLAGMLPAVMVPKPVLDYWVCANTHASAEKG